MSGLRDEFPFFRHHPNLIYLDSAATAHKPDCVIDSLVQFYSKDYGTVHRSVYQSSRQSSELYAAAREAARRFLSAGCVEEIVFTRGTTDAINLVARSFPFQAGDEIFVSEAEHHSNLVPWQLAAERSGAILRILPLRDDGSIELPERFPEKTKMIALAHVSNVTGAVLDPSRIVRPAGAALLLDGAQAAPHLKIDVEALGADFYAFSGHKCYGPTGIGVLYGKQPWLDRLAPVQAGGGMVQRVDLFESTYERAPLRFEAGTPMIASAIGLKTALEFIERTRDGAHELEQKLLRAGTERLERIDGLRVIGRVPDKGPILTFLIEGVHPLDLATLLDCKQIAIRSGHLCTQPLLRRFGATAASRASFALYNTMDEVEMFADAVESAVQSLRASSIVL